MAWIRSSNLKAMEELPAAKWFWLKLVDSILIGSRNQMRSCKIFIRFSRNNFLIILNLTEVKHNSDVENIVYTSLRQIFFII